MAKRRVTAAAKAEPVFVWAFRSSQPRGGQFINYETRMNEDGALTCNCPGWVFCRTKDKAGNVLNNGIKTCTHTRQVLDEADDILRRFRRGDPLPQFDAPAVGVTTGRMSTATSNISNKPKSIDHSTIKYGRVIEF